MSPRSVLKRLRCGSLRLLEVSNNYVGLESQFLNALKNGKL